MPMSIDNSSMKPGRDLYCQTALNLPRLTRYRAHLIRMRILNYRLMLIIVVALATMPAQANPLGLGKGGGLINRPGVEDTQLRPSQLRSSLSSREAVSIAERRYGGRAVSVRQIQSGGSVAYKVRILQDNGKIKNVIIGD